MHVVRKSRGSTSCGGRILASFSATLPGARFTTSVFVHVSVSPHYVFLVQLEWLVSVLVSSRSYSENQSTFVVS